MTSLAQTIEVDFENFFKGTETDAEKFFAAFEKLFKKAPSVLQTVQNFVSEVAPAVTAAVALAAPAADPVVISALAIAETGLAAVQAAITNAASGGSLLQDLQNFANDVPSLLSGLQIKDSNLQATITKIVNLVVGEAKVLIPAVQSWVQQLEAAASSPAPAAGSTTEAPAAA